MRKWLLLLVLFCCTATPPSASAQFIQQRFLPASGVRGTLGDPQEFPNVQINRQLFRLSPGARIYDQSNRTIVHGHLPTGVEVLVAREPSGAITRMYILTEQEIERLKQAQR